MKLSFFSRFLTGNATFLLLCLLFIQCINAQTKSQSTDKNIQTMTPVGYIISLRTSGTSISNREVVQAMIKITGQWLPVMGMSKDSISRNLLIIPAGNKSAQELITQLQPIADVSDVSIVALSRPAKKEELAQVRKLFAGFDLDARTVSDGQLSSFLTSKLDGQYTYYIDQDRKRNTKGLHDMHIKRLEEHPQYSPDWRKDRVHLPQDTAQISDTIEVRDVLVQTVEEIEPPPPPPPPANLSQMTDAQIRKWIRKYDPHKLKDQDIQIKHTPEETIITIKRKDRTETVYYKAKK